MKYLFLSIVISLVACQQSTNDYQVVSGYTQGTTYQITYEDTLHRDFKEEIEAILMHYDYALSNYNINSTLSLFNKQDSIVTVIDTFGYFTDVLLQSLMLQEKTNGAFNPAVWPLVQAWGFGTDKKTGIAPSKIDSLIKLTNISENSYTLEPNEVGLKLTYYKNSHQTFDFNAIAQGNSVDVLFDFLRKQGVINLLVEIGGEVRASGVNDRNEVWKLGVDKPIDNQSDRRLEAIVSLQNRALATSGNYRKFMMIDGEKYAHTINPETGKPVTHQLLSATVMAETATLADAMATAFMVMGMKESKLFLQQHPEMSLEVFLIEAVEDSFNTYTSPGLIKLIQSLN